MSTPTVSIVVPAYNAERYLRETLESILAQTCVDWELVIVDDGSTDSTPTIAAEYAARDPRIRLVRQQNRGLAGARNGGIAASNPNSRYLIFLDADDLWEPIALQTLLDAHAANPAALIVFGDARYIDPTGKEMANERRNHIPERKTIRDGRFVDEDESAPITFETLLAGNQIQTAGCALIPRSTVDRVGLFDERLRRSEDWLYWLRASVHGPIACVDRTVLAYRVHPESLSRNHQAQLDDAAKTLKILVASDDVSAERKAAIDMVYAVRMGIGAGRIGEWEEAIRMIGRSQNRLRYNREPRTVDVTLVNGPLLIALNGNAEIAEQLAESEKGVEGGMWTRENRRRLNGASQRLKKQRVWIRSRLAARAIRQRDCPAALQLVLKLAVDWVSSG